ncbi:hypothetical protein GWI33_011988 [Rhynchophorus ferrugineus]|uniref:Uncharacterized protein n=1 Tax=Rhynchophorus ferrugineus TaxID=354439 RepID=A0A834IQ36_RHYFE|nr:hypothetical protein GWI33_011988 [Rhynchophorus ferrugineus]
MRLTLTITRISRTTSERNEINNERTNDICFCHLTTHLHTVHGMLISTGSHLRKWHRQRPSDMDLSDAFVSRSFALVIGPQFPTHSEWLQRRAASFVSRGLGTENFNWPHRAVLFAPTTTSVVD